MPAPKTNQYWKLIKEWNVDKIYTTETLWTKALEYFYWVENNPLREEKVFGSGKRMNAKKMRAMTVRGFCIFANIARSTFQEYEKDEALSVITAKIREIIYTQKFEGAAAGLFETNIIARELGLIDKQEVTMTNKDIANSPLNDLSDEALQAIEQTIANDTTRAK